MNKEGKMSSHRYFEMSFPRLIVIACLFPFFGVLICEMGCVLFAFKVSTTTVCNSGEKPWNFLPSISAATGTLSPQRYIWRIFIALHATPRFLIAAGYYNMHKELFKGNSRKTSRFLYMAHIAFILHVTEIMALLGLTFISSKEDYEIHKYCFGTFMLCATVHMILMCVLCRFGRKAVQFSLTLKEVLSARFKGILLATNIIASTAAMYFFNRHNTMCEDGVYSLFAICEIVVVLTNVAFHGTAVMDFPSTVVILQDGIHADR